MYGGAVLLLTETEGNFGSDRSINVTIDDCAFERCRVDRYRLPTLVSSSQIEAQSDAMHAPHAGLLTVELLHNTHLVFFCSSLCALQTALAALLR